jgi:predicted MPP superfamily phosphohydrolase
VVLTGDFATYDPATAGAVVQALSPLKAPFGVFGCLGNHEIYTETQHSITRLFAVEGIHILRQARLPLQTRGETLNLIGVDFQGRHGPPLPPSAYLRRVERLMMPDTANILLSHNPNSFDRAAELGMDLSLAGHTHGGQLSLSFVNRGLSLVRPETAYVSGWYEKAGSQLYVNRGIGTIGVPIRLGARPEITVLELTGT